MLVVDDSIVLMVIPTELCGLRGGIDILGPCDLIPTDDVLTMYMLVVY